MVISLVFLTFFVVLGLAGLTGFGVADSRDARFSLGRQSRDDGRAGYEHLVAPQGRPSARIGVRR